jgi:ABC-type multidrug transport system fused ATPase/permease subunit
LTALDGLALFLVSRMLQVSNGANFSSKGLSGLSLLLFVIVILFISRSLFATLVTWYSMRELAKQEVDFGQKRLDQMYAAPLEIRLGYDLSDYFTAVDRGPKNLVQGYLLVVATVVAEFFSGVIILGVLAFLEPLTALLATVFFVGVAILQHKLLSTAQDKAGHEVLVRSNSTYELLRDYYNLDKVLHVFPSNSLEHALRSQRDELALARARQSFISSLPRYVMESVLALGFLVVAFGNWIVFGPSEVTLALAIFSAAGYRMLPIVNRIQGLILSAIGSAPVAKMALDRLWDKTPNSKMSISHESESPLLRLEGVSFTYAGNTTPSLKDVSISFEAGFQYAVVGPSGSGKTTFVDICLGLLFPQEGYVFRSKEIDKYKLGYVPQDTHITSGGMLENVALEWDLGKVDKSKALLALDEVHLSNVVSDRNMINLEKNERLNLSGGERQRLGLARALYRDCKFLVLDEATSSLDAFTESQVMQTVDNLKGDLTVLIVAHRLSSIKNCDKIIYIDNGSILGVGSFSELQRLVPQFEEQVRLGYIDLI